MTLEMPVLGAGTFRLKGDDAYNSVIMALEEGYRHIDTAQIYENEEGVGRALYDSSVPREEIFLTTKVWIDRLSKDAFLPSLHESLAKLQTSYVDLLLIHWPLKDDRVSMTEYLGELKKAKDLGLAREIGVSNFTVAQVEEAVSILGKGVLFTNQIEVHPFLQNRKVREASEALGLKVTGFMPLAVGEAITNPTIVAIAEKHGATAAQVTLAWVRQNDMVTIPSSTKRKNLEANLKSLDLTLDADDLAQIAALDEGKRIADPDFAPEWD
ncbi:2,5-didehydrogluconate reductase DkgB [Pseudovibrio exalbescens]|uniref:2,5-didehydrogluconate reductase DkgB n=1 Tax=Pseudovibrio exalbescens TaxID=197461 RepID=UPI002367245F|nr:2,5-didehydrogluconate reductase DkgB [Pseudovibrio exalbescens]MDD7908492.1 2,5-didehydrogluconate reductase DkgB [Pseudovibrio exalbescens]